MGNSVDLPRPHASSDNVPLAGRLTATDSKCAGSLHLQKCPGNTSHEFAVVDLRLVLDNASACQQRAKGARWRKFRAFRALA